MCECVLDAGALPVVLAELERSPLAGGWKSANQDYRVGDFVRVCGTVEAGTLSAGASLPSGAKAIVASRDDMLPGFYGVHLPETGQAASVRANNMLHEPRHGEVLRQEGILYAPDYVVNAAGIINVAAERLPGGYDEDAAMGRINRIADNLREVFELAEAEGVATNRAAEHLAEKRIAAAKQPC